MSYKVEINAAPKQLQEMMQDVINKKIDTAKELKPEPPGVLPTLGDDQDCKMYLAGPGTWTHTTMSPNLVLTETEKAMVWWDKEFQSWSSHEKQDLKGDKPEGTDTLEDDEIPKGKAIEKYVSDLNIFNKKNKTPIEVDVILGSVRRSDTGGITSPVEYPNQARTDYIPVSPGDTIYIDGLQSNVIGVSGYNNAKIFNSRLSDSSDLSLFKSSISLNFPIEIPENVYFIVATTLNNETNPVSVKTEITLDQKLESIHYNFYEDLEIAVSGVRSEIEQQLEPILPLLEPSTNPGIIGGDLSFIVEGSIKDIYIDTNSLQEDIYLATLRNSSTQRPLIQFLAGDAGIPPATPVLYQWYPTDIYLRTGLETIRLRREAAGVSVRPYVDIVMDWDKFGQRNYVKNDGGRLRITTGLLNTSPSVTFAERFEDIEDKVEGVASIPDYLKNDLPLNVFGDVLPSNIKRKLLAMEEDVEIIFTGNSITGLIEGATPFVDEAASHLPPGFTHKFWPYLIWDNINKNKPVSDRLDSKRGGIDTFSTIGVWEKIVNGKFDTPTDIPAGEYSYSALTYQSPDLNASASCSWDTSEFSKASLVFSINPDGADAVLAIDSGNGKILASLDKQTWVEANGFSITGRSNDGLTNVQARAEGVALHQRHRRIWLKPVAGISETVTLTYSRNDATAGRYLYFWGVEKWNHSTVFVTNLGRGGRRTRMLTDNITDISNRRPDLVFYEMPVANEFKDENFEYLKTVYNSMFFNSSSTKSLFSKSNGYEDTDCIIFLPHSRGTGWEGNQAILDPNYLDEILPYIKSKRLMSYLIDRTDELDLDSKIKFVNLLDQIINEIQYRGMTVEEALTASLANPGRFVNDTVHLNDKGSEVYTKYLSPIFNLV